MPIDITSISALINQDLLRPNRFQVQIAGAPDLVNQLCCATDFPGNTFSTFNWRNAGPVIKVPMEPTFTEVVMDFYCDAQGTVPNWVRQWNRQIMSEDWDMNFFADYVKDIDIWEINTQGQQVSHVKLVNAYPLTVSGVKLAFENMNQVEKISATVVYEYYELG